MAARIMNTGNPQEKVPAGSFRDRSLPQDGLVPQTARQQRETQLNRIVLHIVNFDGGLLENRLFGSTANGVVAQRIAAAVREKEDCLPTLEQMGLLNQLFQRSGSRMGGKQVGGSTVANQGRERAVEALTALQDEVNAR